MTFNMRNNTSGVAWIALRKKRGFDYVQVSWRRRRKLYNTCFALGGSPLLAVTRAVEAWEQGTGYAYPLTPRQVFTKLMASPQMRKAHLHYTSGAANPLKVKSPNQRFMAMRI